MKQKIEVALFPVAGMGTRFLPITKSCPKEMLPIVDKPLIQYAVEEALSANIKELVFITRSDQYAIKDYFGTNHVLENHLKQQEKHDILSVVKNILPTDARFVYVHQKYPHGLGDAILRAKPIVGDRPFAVLLADDMIDADEGSCLQEMVAAHETTRTNMIAVKAVPMADTHRYGIVSLVKQSNMLEAIVEKPTPPETPSCLAVIGRYILTANIFEHLENTRAGAGGEIQLTDAIAALLPHEPVSAFPLNRCHYDCGSYIGFLEANIAYTLKRPEWREQLLRYLQTLST